MSDYKSKAQQEDKFAAWHHARGVAITPQMLVGRCLTMTSATSHPDLTVVSVECSDKFDWLCGNDLCKQQVVVVFRRKNAWSVSACRECWNAMAQWISSDPRAVVQRHPWLRSK